MCAILLVIGCNKPRPSFDITYKNLFTDIHMGMSADSLKKIFSDKYFLQKMDSGRLSNSFLGKKVITYLGGTFYKIRTTSFELFIDESENQSNDILKAIQITIKNGDSTELTNNFKKLVIISDSVLYKVSNEGVTFQGRQDNIFPLEQSILKKCELNKPSEYSFYNGGGFDALMNDNHTYWFYPGKKQKEVKVNGVLLNQNPGGYIGCDNRVVIYKRKGYIIAVITTPSEIMFNK